METQFKNMLWEKRKKGVLVAAHRGTNGANIIQNTCLACENALLHNADMMEVDGILSTDGIFFAFHDGEEESLWGIKCDIRRMTSAEIERFPCRNQLDAYVDQRVERLEQILERFKGRGLINIVDPYLQEEKDPFMEEDFDRVKELEWIKILLCDTHEHLEKVDKQLMECELGEVCDHFYSQDFSLRLHPKIIPKEQLFVLSALTVK